MVISYFFMLITEATKDRDVFLEELLSKRPRPYQRIFGANSDPTISAGMLASNIASAMFIKKASAIEEKTGTILPIIFGPGSSAERGMLRPETVEDFVRHNKGISCVTIQSSFIYDNPSNLVSEAIEQLNERLKKSFASREKIQPVSEKDTHDLERIMTRSAAGSAPVDQEVGDYINHIAQNMENRRDRFSHTGLFGYGRGEEGQTRPRAIKYVGSSYSLGIPMGVFGAGVSPEEKEAIADFCPLYFDKLKESLRYVNDRNIERLNLQQVKKGVENARKLVDAPEPDENYRSLSGAVLDNIDNPKKLRGALREAEDYRNFAG